MRSFRLYVTARGWRLVIRLLRIVGSGLNGPSSARVSWQWNHLVLHELAVVYVHCELHLPNTAVYRWAQEDFTKSTPGEFLQSPNLSELHVHCTSHYWNVYRGSKRRNKLNPDPSGSWEEPHLCSRSVHTLPAYYCNVHMRPRKLYQTKSRGTGGSTSVLHQLTVHTCRVL